jgi:cytochrome P450
MHKQFEQYGDIFQASVAWSGTIHLVFVNEPKAVQYMLTHDTGKEFTAPGEVNAILEPLLGRQNLLIAERSAASAATTTGDAALPWRTAESLWRDHSADYCGGDRPMAHRRAAECARTMQKITMRVILQAVFGLHQGERYEQLERLLSLRLEMTDTPLASVILFMPWLQKDFGAWSPGGANSALGRRDRCLAVC